MKGQSQLLKMDRRTLLIGGGIGVGLIVGWSSWRWLAQPQGRNEARFGSYLKIGRDGRVIVAVPQVETGQGIWTALPQLVADELGAAWEMVGVEPAPFGPGFVNPLAGGQDCFEELGPIRRFQLDDDAARITARSTSVAAFEQPMREAGAIARAMLVATAAARWNVAPGACDTRDGKVVNGSNSIGFGELAEEAAGRSPSAPRLRARDRPFAGQPMPRLDQPAKSNGAFRFGADVRLPEQLFASVRLAPEGGSIQGFTKAAGIVAGDGWVAGIGDTWWAAERALKAADVRIEAKNNPIPVDALFDDALAAGDATRWYERGDYAGAVEGSRALSAIYRVAPALPFGLEAPNATARVSGDRVEVWAGTQAPGLARMRADHAAGGRVAFYPMPVGDQGGVALENAAVPIAIALARQLKRPVQVGLSPNVAQNHGRPAPGALARMYGLNGPSGAAAAWKMRVVTADGFGASIARLTGSDVPLEALTASASAFPYSVPNVRIDAVAPDLPFAPGYMRGSPERELTFFTESFADEMARAAGLDPLSYRIAMLGTNPRLANCLQRATSAAGWDGGGVGSIMGLAVASAFGSHIALVAEASIGSDQRIEVHRLVASVDCGRIVNTRIVRQQIEGGLMWALGQATVAAPEWSGGMPLSRTFRALGLPRIDKVPDIRVDLVPSAAAPGGVNGLATVVLAPALANALHAGTGKRMRSLPFDVMAA